MKHWAFRQLSRAYGALARPTPGLRVLLYHSVGTALPEDPYGIALSEGAFRDHLDWLLTLRPAWSFVPFGRPAGRPELALTFDDGFRDTLRVAAPLLAERGLPFAVFVTAGHIRRASSLYLNPTQLRELAAFPGALVGAHGDSHRPLASLDDDELSRELAESRKFLEDTLGRPVDALAYPHGDVDRRVRDAAERAGYALGGCSRYGLNRPERDPLLLCRTEITAFDSAEDARLKTLGAWDWYRWRRPDPARPR